MEIALLRMDAMPPADFAFLAGACAIQLEKHIMPIWGPYLQVEPDIHWPVVAYDHQHNLKPGFHHPLICVGKIDDPGILGDHSGMRATNTAFGRFKPDSTVASHECGEMRADPFCSWWVPIPGRDGDVEACEISDRVEGDTYPIDVTIGNETRAIQVSNWLYPEAFGIVTHRTISDGFRRQYDHMGLLTRPEENRGYRIVRHPDGSIENEFADQMGAAARERVIAKLGDPRSRAAQRRR